MNSGLSIEAETQDKEESEEEEKKEAAAGNHSFLWDSKLIGHPSHFLIKGEPFHQGHGFTKSLKLYLTPQIQKTDAMQHFYMISQQADGYSTTKGWVCQAIL